MSLFGRDVAEWRALADALSLTPYRPTATYDFGATFRQVKRALGVPSDGSSFSHPLYGTHRGVEIIVHTFDVGSGSSATTYTGVLARIDPPLLLGFGLREKGFFENAFGTPRVTFGDYTLDKKLYVDGFEPERVYHLLAPNDAGGRDLLARAMGLLPYYLHVSDSAVLVAQAGTITDRARIWTFAEQATALASAFAARRRALPLSAAEHALHGEWGRYAESHGLAYDPERTRLEGLASGTRVEIAIETAGQLAFTVVSALFPQQVDVAFSLFKTSVPSFLQGIFSQDIVVGHRAFDDAYKVSGVPVDRVQELFRRPGLAETLARLAQAAAEVQMNHAQLYARLRGAIHRSDQLAATIDTVRFVSEALFGAARALGPYR